MSPEPPARDARLTVFLLGCATVVAQALLVREAMAAMGGSEVAWGVVMALWLAGVAVGARLGTRRGSRVLANWLPTVVLVLAGVGVVLLRAAPAILGVAPGEVVTTGSAIWLWILAISPAAVAGGAAFPILAHALGSGGGGRAYGLEALGALIGGTLLSLGLVFVGTATATLLAVAVVLAGAAWQRRSCGTATCVLLALAFSVPAGGALARAEWSWAGRPGVLRDWLETRCQEISVSDGPPTAVYADGRLLASYPEPWTVLPRAHLLMLLHPSPRHVFALGCAVDGSIEAMAAHPVSSMTVAEDDPDLLRALPKLYGATLAAVLDRPTVQSVATDPLRAITLRDDWDLVILLDGNPLTLRRNRTRTLEFFRLCRSHMHPDGVIVVRVVVPDSYVGGTGGQLLSVLSSTVHDVFSHVDLIPGEETLIVAGGPEADISLAPEVLAERLRASGVGPPEFQPEMIPILIDRERSHDLAERLRLDTQPNTISRPRAVLPAIGLHETRVLPGLLELTRLIDRAPDRPVAAIFGAMALLVIGAAVIRPLAPAAAAAAVGFCSMGWWLILIAAWQSTRGSIYSEMGVLTGTFMAGVAVGSLAAGRWRRPERVLPYVMMSGSALSISIAAGVAIAIPTVAVPLLLAGSGALTGAAFPGLALMAGCDTRRGAAVAFAADEAGAAAAAVALGVIIIPWAGMASAATGLAVLQIAAIPAVLSRMRRH